MIDDLAGKSAGQRIRYFRDRAGMSRPVLGGLVGRGADWVKAVENGRLMTPRLPLLLRLAEVLGVDDLAKLTGEQKLSSATYTRAAHEHLPAVERALTTYPIAPAEDGPLDPSELETRVVQLWELWHGTKRQRTAIGGFLPALLQDARATVRRLDGTERRRALRALAQTYHLAQLFLAFQPVPELIYMTGDRAMTAAQDADDPRAMAVAAWYLNHVYRSAGQRHEERVQLALDTARIAAPGRRPGGPGTVGAAASGRRDVVREGRPRRGRVAVLGPSNEAARSLGPGYVHPYMIFGQGMVDAHAVTLHVDLMRGGEAVQVANKLDLSGIPSPTRRSVHLTDTARAYGLRREPVAVVHLLRKAYDESPDRPSSTCSPGPRSYGFWKVAAAPYETRCATSRTSSNS